MRIFVHGLTIGVALALTSGAAGAQVSDAPRGGVTVTGRGTVLVAPDRARVQIRLFARAGPGSVGSLEEAGRTLAQAMQKAGMSGAQLVLPLDGFVGSGAQPAVVATIEKPTRPNMERMVRDTLKLLPDGYAAQNFQVVSAFVVDDCAAAESRAQSAALADARLRAGRAAQAAGIHLGPVLALNESATFPAPACRSAADGVPVQPSGLDPYGPIVVPIAVTANVTFAIR